MATVTELAKGGSGWTAGVTDFDTSSITPGTNCLLVLMWGSAVDTVVNRQSIPATFTSSGSGPSWTSRYDQANTANYAPGAEVATAEIGGTDPGSFTVNIEAADTVDNMGAYVWIIYRITGYDTGTPIVGGGADGASSGGDGAKTLTQSATPGSTDVTFAMSVANANGNSTGGDDATFDTTTGTFTATTGITQEGGDGDLPTSAGYRTGYSTDADIDWADINTGTGTYEWAAVAITIAGGTAPTNLVVADLAVASTIDTVALTQVHELVVADLAVASTIDTVTLETSIDLVVADLAVASTIDTVALTQVHELVVADLSVASTIDTVALTQVHELVVADLSVATTIDTVTLAAGDPDLHPSSISGHKLLNPSGEVILGHTLSSWALYRLTRTNITTALTDVADAGFNGVTVWFGGGYDLGGSWSNPYQNGDGEDFWTGTPWQSDFDTGWDTYDHIVNECLRLGLTVHLSIGVGFGSTGAQAEIEAATDAQMIDVGEAIATRYSYLYYPNVVWHVMFDDSNTTGSTIGSRIDSYFFGIDTIEGDIRPIRWVENNQGDSTYEAGWYSTGFSQFSINCEYDYGDDATDIIDAALADVDGSPNAVAPYGDCEPPYVGAPHYGGNEGQQLRERTYSVFIRGGCLINFGHEAWWHFGEGGLYTPSVAQGQSWDEVLDGTRIEMTRQSYAMAFADQWCRTTDFQATSSFVTTGEGTGDIRAAQGASGTVALAYFPASRTIEVDTTILDGTGNVRLRWYDPTDDSYSTIAASEAQQTGRSITHPGNSTNAGGQSDYILVVDLLELTLIVADLAVASTIDTVALTQVHDLTVADLAVVTSIDAVALTQVHDLVVADLAVATTIDTVTLTQVHELVVADLAVAVTIDTPTLTVGGISLDVAPLDIATTIDAVALTQVHDLVVADMTVASTIDTVALTQVHDLVVADLTVAVTIDTPTLTVGGINLIVADLSVASTIDTIALTQVHSLAVADLAVATTIDTVALGVVGDGDVYLGANPITNIYLGATPVADVYLGSTIIWETP